ncbi:MAG: C-GCAxxG-C-C family protein [Phycisphaerae bacterium]
MSKPKEAEATFRIGFNCCQAVVTSLCRELGVPRKTALRIATGFGGGMAHLGQTCGAVTGAIMLIGLAHGRVKASDDKPKLAAMKLVQKFARRFTKLHGSINCNELVGFDLGTSAGLEKARAKGVFKTVCPVLVRDAARIVEKLLAK